MATNFRMSLRRLAWLGVFAPLAVVCAGAVEPAGTHHIERLPQPSAGAGIDLAQVARGFDAAGVGGAPPLAGTRLIVFISLAMPEGALRRLCPKVGTLLLFPSDLFHRTLPYAGSGERISISFDLAAV